MISLPRLLLALAVTLPAGKEPFLVIQKQGPASLAVSDAGKGELEVALSGLLRLRLTVAGTADLEVQPVEPATLAEGWRVHAAGKPSRPGPDRWQQEILLEPLKPGRLTLTLEPLRYRQKAGPWQGAHWKPIQVTVKTSAQPDLKDLRDITTPEDLPEGQSHDWSPWFWLAAVGAGAVLLIVTAVRRRKRGEVARSSPEQRSLRDLDRIVALQLASLGKTVEFHFLVHDVVRRYLNRRYRIAARCRTTSELLKRLSTSEVPAHRQELLARFFERCDPARFSGRSPSEAECAETLEIARRIVTLHTSIEA